MNKKFLSTTLFLIILLTGLTFNIRTVNSPVEVKSTPLFGFDLIKPPLHVYAATDYSAPLDTSDIGMFCYYQQAGGWTLVDTVAAWEEYTNYGTYYDGLVRIYHDPTGNDFESGEDGATGYSHSYIDVHVRVRTDGYVLAWLNQTDDGKKFIPYWGRDMENRGGAWAPPYFDYDTGDVPTEVNATCLSRAVKRVYVAASETFPGHEEVYYYDFEYTLATRFTFFGRGCEELNNNEGAGGITRYMYYTVPTGTIIDFMAAQTAIGYSSGVGGNQAWVKIDGNTVDGNSGAGGYVSLIRYIDLGAGYRTLDVQHTVQIHCQDVAGGYSHAVIIIMVWTH